MVKESCEMSRINIGLNGMEEGKYEVVNSKVEECINSVITQLRQEDSSVNIIGIVDPPRSGLHPTVITALRTCKGLDTLVYVSCNAAGNLSDNITQLCY